MTVAERQQRHRMRTGGLPRFSPTADPREVVDYVAKTGGNEALRHLWDRTMGEASDAVMLLGKIAERAGGERARPVLEELAVAYDRLEDAGRRAMNPDKEA
jgi:hypothetical protein